MKLMSAADVATHLGIKKSAAYDLLHREDFPTISWGRNLYVRQQDLDAWLLQQRRYSTEEVDYAKKQSSNR